MGRNSQQTFMIMDTVTTNQNPQKNFSEEQLQYLCLSLEQALQVPYLQTIEVTPEMLEEQRGRIRLAEKAVRRPSWKLWRKYGGISYSFKRKRFIYGNHKGGKDRGEWLGSAVEWGIDNFPDLYEKECLKCMELGLKPWKGLILRRVYFM